MTPTQFNSEYEILNWLSKHENFAQGVDQLRTASANGQLTGGRGLVEKWLSVYDDVTAGRVVAPSGTGTAAPQQPGTARHGDGEAADEADRRGDAYAARSIMQESQLWAEAAREAAGRADLAVTRLQLPLQRARRWGKLGFVFGLLALLLVLVQGWLLWPQIETRLNSLQQSVRR